MSAPETLARVPHVCAEGVPVFQTPRKDSALVKTMFSFAVLCDYLIWSMKPFATESAPFPAKHKQIFKKLFYHLHLPHHNFVPEILLPTICVALTGPGEEQRKVTWESTLIWLSLDSQIYFSIFYQVIF